MSIRYAPYIEGTIPAFGSILKVPFEWNSGVAPASVKSMVAKILDMNNINQEYVETTIEWGKNENSEDIIEKFNIINFSTPAITEQRYYKVQIAYSDTTLDTWKKLTENKSKQDKEYYQSLTYSSIGIGKYFGNTTIPTITNLPTTDSINEISYTINNSGEELYSLIVINSENKELQELYIKQNQDKTSIVNLAIETRKVKGKTINGYITDSVDLEISTFDEESIINSLLQNTDNEHIYLVSKDKTLCVKFNPKISSFKTTIQETKTDTIGGKYPMFYRNGTLGYKEFPINGLISYHMDDNEDFMTKAELGLETEKSIRAKTANGESAAAFNIPTHNLVEYNIVAERKFRNAVLDWLSNGEVKLFKSPTEGMYLIRLMNISLSPEEKLGRMLYSFSATAYEVGEVNYENLVKYSFIDKIEGVDYVIR